MHLRVLLFSLALFGTSCSADQNAKFAAHQIMHVVEKSIPLNDITSILYLLDPSFNYTMCGYQGNMNTFGGYLKVQMNSLVDLKFLVDYDNAYIESSNDIETLTFHVDTTAIYKDRSRVEGGAVVTAIKQKNGPIFYLSNIHQQCRVTAKRHHRLYRLFTNENLYDYRK
uniref:SnoaL-like domain-containing protein n=1 Tax=Caenorhabditis tropicalis TaxID=1561998 RepID=A0A1I7UB50_9PELO